MDNVLNLFRMEADDHFGLRPEPVTWTEFQQQVYAYCIGVFGRWVNKDIWAEKTVALPDMNAVQILQPYDDLPPRAMVRLRAITSKRAIEDFEGWCAVQDGFDYPPYGPGAQSFGFYSKSTIAWIYPHRDNPALLFKATTNDNVSAVTTFLEHAASLEIAPAWPVKPKHPVIIVPEAMRVISQRPGNMRRARARAKVVRSHLRSR